MEFKLRPELEIVSSKNTLTSYFPIRTKDGYGVFNWDAILGHFVKCAYRKELRNNDIEQFKNSCKTSFLKKLDEGKLWETIELMYFQNNELFEISPELLLFKAVKVKGSAPDGRMGKLFNSLLNGFYLKKKPEMNLNFLESEIVNIFSGYVVSGEHKGTIVNASREEPYLPFLSDVFVKDLEFLSSKPKYLLSYFKEFLQLYSFLYTSQLALNLKEWRSGEAVSKPCYFIIDNEKASDERSDIKLTGYKQLRRSIEFIFPYLSMNESLQDPSAVKIPLWEVRNKLEENSENLNVLNNYAKNFSENRGLSLKSSINHNCLDVLNNLLTLSVAQFKRGETRYEINIKYCRAVETEICGRFVQSRGRAGRVLVLNQDVLILLTNLSIGDNPKLRFHELLLQFEKRGVYFDKQSQQVLINLYERIGNVERMSDSGDAVYVRKTI